LTGTQRILNWRVGHWHLTTSCRWKRAVWIALRISNHYAILDKKVLEKVAITKKVRRIFDYLIS